MPRRARIDLVILLAGIAVAAGCSASAEDAGVAVDAVDGRHVVALDEVAELDSILGDDRVARFVHANPTAIPDHLAEFEAAFGVGRSCNRSASKEIWVAEEKDTRITGAQVETPDLEPRLVIGGCNQHPAGSQRETFELMVAMVSDASRPIADPIPTQPVETMALDNTTGLFNFYVFEPALKENGPATLTRFVRRADGVVEKWQKIDGQPATKAVNDTPKCFNCHVHGGPIMNEMSERHVGPWTNWVSSKKTFSRALTGDSAALVNESRPLGEPTGRSSLADDLEQATVAAIATWVEGLPGVPGSGLARQVLSGAQPGGMPALLRSVLCETEVNYASVDDTVPRSLFVDSAVAAVAGLEAPVPPVVGARWTLLPTRSETDRRIELYLEKQHILSPDVVLAARVLDDTHDVFSAKRCAVHAAVVANLAAPMEPEAAMRSALLAALDEATPPIPRAYVQALLDPSVSADGRAAAEAAYIADVGARLNADATKLGTPSGLTELAARWTERQGLARAMFPRPENPLPRTPSAPAVAALR